MLGYFFLSLLMGTTGVLQNTINRKIAANWGLPITLVVNSVVMLVISVSVFFLLRIPAEGSLPEMLRPKGSIAGFSWLHILPGLFGYVIICCIPVAVSRVGATKIFIAIIGAQIVTSMLWDFWFEGINATPTRIAGAILAFLGALLTMR